MDPKVLQIRDLLISEFADDISIDDLDAVAIKVDYTRIAQNIVSIMRE